VCGECGYGGLGGVGGEVLCVLMLLVDSQETSPVLHSFCSCFEAYLLQSLP
jgi:hypothetical protein